MRKIFLTIVLLVSNSCFAEVYKWTDDKGNTHYSSTPPAKQINTQKILESSVPTATPAPFAPDEINSHTLSIEERKRLYGNIKLTSIPSNGVAQQELYKLFNQIISACNSKQPQNYFALLTVQVREGLIHTMPVEEQQKAFTQYCNDFSKANSAMGGKPENGIHSVEQEQNRATNGHKITYWYIHTKQGQRIFRLEIVLENNQLKIEAH